MSRIRLFQAAVLASAVLYAIWFVLPHVPIERSAETRQLLGMSGYGAAPMVLHPAFYLDRDG